MAIYNVTELSQKIVDEVRALAAPTKVYLNDTLVVDNLETRALLDKVIAAIPRGCTLILPTNASVNFVQSTIDSLKGGRKLDLSPGFTNPSYAIALEIGVNLGVNIKLSTQPQIRHNVKVGYRRNEYAMMGRWGFELPAAPLEKGLPEEGESVSIEPVEMTSSPVVSDEIVANKLQPSLIEQVKTLKAGQCLVLGPDLTITPETQTLFDNLIAALPPKAILKWKANTPRCCVVPTIEQLGKDNILDISDEDINTQVIKTLIKGVHINVELKLLADVTSGAWYSKPEFYTLLGTRENKKAELAKLLTSYTLQSQGSQVEHHTKRPKPTHRFSKDSPCSSMLFSGNPAANFILDPASYGLSSQDQFTLEFLYQLSPFNWDGESSQVTLRAPSSLLNPNTNATPAAHGAPFQTGSQQAFPFSYAMTLQAPFGIPGNSIATPAVHSAPSQTGSQQDTSSLHGGSQQAASFPTSLGALPQSSSSSLTSESGSNINGRPTAAQSALDKDENVVANSLLSLLSGDSRAQPSRQGLFGSLQNKPDENPSPSAPKPNNLQ